MCRIKIPNPMQIPKDPENTWMEIFELIENTLCAYELMNYAYDDNVSAYAKGYATALKDIKEIIET